MSKVKGRRAHGMSHPRTARLLGGAGIDPHNVGAGNPNSVVDPAEALGDSGMNRTAPPMGNDGTGGMSLGGLGGASPAGGAGGGMPFRRGGRVR